MDNKKLWIIGGTLLLGFVAYKTMKPVDNFITNFQAEVINTSVDFKNADIGNKTVPVLVTTSLKNSEAFSPKIESIVVIVSTKDEKGNWNSIFTSDPSSPFVVNPRSITNKTIKFSLPLLSIGMDLIKLGKKAIKGEKMEFMFTVNTNVMGTILTEKVFKEF